MLPHEPVTTRWVAKQPYTKVLPIDSSTIMIDSLTLKSGIGANGVHLWCHTKMNNESYLMKRSPSFMIGGSWATTKNLPRCLSKKKRMLMWPKGVQEKVVAAELTFINVKIEGQGRDWQGRCSDRHLRTLHMTSCCCHSANSSHILDTLQPFGASSSMSLECIEWEWPCLTSHQSRGESMMLLKQVGLILIWICKCKNS